jgi:hypothetical protein
MNDKTTTQSMFEEMRSELTIELRTQMKAEFLFADQMMKQQMDIMMDKIKKEIKESMKETLGELIREQRLPAVQLQEINSNNKNNFNYIKMDIEYDEFQKNCLDEDKITQQITRDKRWSEFLDLIR